MMQTQSLIARVRIWQAHYGSVSLKPADLAHCHIAAFETTLQQGREKIQWGKLIKLQGKNAQGQWNTAQAKEYPAKLNALLAASLINANCMPDEATDIADAPLPDAVQTAFNELYAGDVDQTKQEMRPDYHKVHRQQDLEQPD